MEGINMARYDSGIKVYRAGSEFLAINLGEVRYVTGDISNVIIVLTDGVVLSVGLAVAGKLLDDLEKIG